MIDLTTAKRNLLKASRFAYHAILEIEDPDGVYKDMSNIGGKDFFHSASWGADVDTPVEAGTISLIREIGNESIAPLIEGSLLNRNAVNAYAALVNVSRGFRLKVAVTTPGTTPAAGDYRTVYQGKIDTVDWGGDEGLLEIAVRDPGAWLQIAQIKTKRVYASTDTALATVIQSIITDNAVKDNPQLYTIGDPSWMLTEFEQKDGESVLDAITALADQIGWVVRYRWVETSPDIWEYRLCLYNPRVEPATVATTFAPDEYYEVQNASMTDEGVRNDIDLHYFDTAGVLQTRNIKDAASIAEYDTRWMAINESETSNIDTVAEADRFLNAVLNDLRIPEFEMSILTNLFDAVQLGDFYGFLSNSDVHDTQKDMYVLSYKHELSNGTGTTEFGLRGKPAGAYERWLRMDLTGSPQYETDYTRTASENAAGTVGTLSITITDYANRLSTVQFYETDGAGVKTGPFSATRVSGLTYERDITLHAQHNVFIEEVVTLKDGTVIRKGPVTFDHNKYAQLLGSPVVSYNADQATVRAVGDSDTASLWYQESTDGGATWTAETQFATTFEGEFVVTASQTAKRLFRVYGKNSSGASGQTARVYIDRYDIVDNPEAGVYIHVTGVSWRPSNTESFLGLRFEVGETTKSVRFEYQYASVPGGAIDRTVNYTLDMTANTYAYFHHLQDENGVIKSWTTDDATPNVTITPYDTIGGAGTAGLAKVVNPENLSETGSVGTRVSKDATVYQADRIDVGAELTLQLVNNRPQIGLSSNVPLKNAASNIFTGSLQSNSLIVGSTALEVISATRVLQNVTINAGDIDRGTLLDARLSTNIPRKNLPNLFTGAQGAERAAVGDSGFYVRIPADTAARWEVQAGGRMEWGPGNAARDAFLYRISANRLKTDGGMDFGGIVDMGGFRITTLGDPDPNVNSHAASVGWVKSHVSDVGSTKSAFSDLWQDMIVKGVNVAIIDGAGTVVRSGAEFYATLGGATGSAKGFRVDGGIAYVLDPSTNDGRRVMVVGGDFYIDNTDTTMYLYLGDPYAVGDTWKVDVKLAYTAVPAGKLEHVVAKGISEVVAPDVGLTDAWWGSALAAITGTDNGGATVRLHDQYTAKLYATIDSTKATRSVVYRASPTSFYPANATMDLGISESEASYKDGFRWRTLYAENGNFKTSIKLNGTDVSLSGHTHTPAEIGAEPAFSKNGAFNKNFGTAAGTVAEGNHTHTGYQPAKTALDQVNSVTTATGSTNPYGSLNITGSTNSYVGFHFVEANSYFMIRTTDSLTGVYKDNAWKWMFDGVGSLEVGSVPWARMTGVTKATNESANTLAERDASGDLTARLFRTTYTADGTTATPYVLCLNATGSGADNYARPVAWASFKSKLGWTTGHDRIAALSGSYGSINISGSTNGYGGINFIDEAVTFMVNGTGAQGIYNNSGSWQWYFSGGRLYTGVVGADRITAGTFGGSTIYKFPNHLALGGQATGALHNAFDHLRFGQNTLMGDTNIYLFSNAEYTTNYIAKTTNRSANFTVGLGMFTWRAVTGAVTAGNVVSYNEYMRLDPAAAYLLDVAGSIQAQQFYTTSGGWFRPVGNSGVYWQSHDTRIYSDGSTYLDTGSNNGIRVRDRGLNLKGYVYFDANGFGLLHGAGGWAVRCNVNAIGGTLYGTWHHTGQIRNDGSVSDDDSFGIFWDSGGSGAYAIYREGGAWTTPYPDLRIAFHTGIKIGAHYSYNGTRIYNNSDMVTLIASFGDTDNNTRVYYNLNVSGEVHDVSHRRHKKNIEPWALDREALRSMLPRQWDDRKTGVHRYGFVTDEVADFFASPDRETLIYHRITTQLVAGWQDHEDRIERLEKENEELRRRLAAAEVL